MQAQAPMWAKCDMLVTVGFDRLNKPYYKNRHGRQYTELVLDDVDMRALEQCLRAYLTL